MSELRHLQTLFNFSQFGLIGVIHYFISLYDRNNDSGYFDDKHHSYIFSNWTDAAIPVVMDNLTWELDNLVEHNALPAIARSNDFFDLLQCGLCEVAEVVDSHMRDIYKRDKFRIDKLIVYPGGMYIGLILEA